MSNINKSNHSPAEVARYLGIPESFISVRYSKYSNNNSQAVNDCWDGIKHPDTGESLSSTKGYYVDDNGDSSDRQRCVYSEFRDSGGTLYSYIEHPDRPVKLQISEDKKAKITANNTSSQGAGNSDSGDLTRFSYTSLKILEQALEKFLLQTKRECDCMKSCIAECQPFLRDRTSQDELVNRSYKIVEDIEGTVEPAKKTKEKVSDLLAEMRRLAKYE